MFNEMEPLLRRVASSTSLLDNAPPAPTDPNNAPPGMVRCACGKKNICYSEVKIGNSSFIKGFTDNICRGCISSVKTHAVVVCVKCKAVVSRMAPERFSSGFVIRPNGMYHTNGCPNCIKEVISTFLIEKALFDRANGYPIPGEVAEALKFGLKIK